MGNSPTKESKKAGFPGASLLDSASFLCGKDTTDEDDNEDNEDDKDDKEPTFTGSLLRQADAMCISSPKKEKAEISEQERVNPTSALFARALVSEVTDNPRTMKPAQMAERERRLLKAQDAARKSTGDRKPVGTMGQPNLLGSLAHALKGDDVFTEQAPSQFNRVVPPNSMSENRAQVNTPERPTQTGKHSVTIGLSLSRRHSSLGHPDTVTRQTAFDFNELQDRQYKYVSTTDSSGWMAGGGERGGNISVQDEFPGNNGVTSMLTPQGHHKLAAPDTVHIPIITIDATSPAVVNQIVSALARGEVFIPHMSILPEALSVNGISPPDLVVRFGCERNDDMPPEEWPNWSLEFMHNQLYEYFHDQGAKWNKRPFQITLAKKVRWKTVKHMNRYFSHAERVIDAWREKGPQYLDPQLSYIEGGATPEEVARPHGIYLLRNGVPTNYFAPNFDPPYTTKMTRSLLLNVLAKSWDKKRREWTSEPVPRLVTPTILMATMCGCADPSQGGFIASEVTNTFVEQTMSKTPAVVQLTAVEHDAEEDEDEGLVEKELQPSKSDLQASQLTASTKISSVVLTPYEEEQQTELDTTLEDLHDLDLKEDSQDDESLEDLDLNEEHSVEPTPIETPKVVEQTSSLDSWDNPFQTADNNTNAPRRVGGRYGNSPTPERVRSRGGSPPNGEDNIGTHNSFRRSLTNESEHENNNTNLRSPESESDFSANFRSPTSEKGTNFRSPVSESDFSANFNSPTKESDYATFGSSPANGGAAPSENGTTTTVQHANSTSAKLVARELERKKLREEKLILEREGLDKVSESLENITPKVRLCLHRFLSYSHCFWIVFFLT
jgi:hypothetical protein